MGAHRRHLNKPRHKRTNDRTNSEQPFCVYEGVTTSVRILIHLLLASVLFALTYLSASAFIALFPYYGMKTGVGTLLFAPIGATIFWLLAIRARFFIKACVFAFCVLAVPAVASSLEFYQSFPQMSLVGWWTGYGLSPDGAYVVNGRYEKLETCLEYSKKDFEQEETEGYFCGAQCELDNTASCLYEFQNLSEALSFENPSYLDFVIKSVLRKPFGNQISREPLPR